MTENTQVIDLTVEQVPTPVPKTRKPRKKKGEVTVESSIAGPADPPPCRQLFPHQLETLELMEAAERCPPLIDRETGFYYYRSYGDLTNPVGSGKTTIALQLIKNDKLKFDNAEKINIYVKGNPISGNPQTLFVNSPSKDPQTTFDLFPIPLNVVVCSKALTTVWKKEADALGVTCVVIDVPKQVFSNNMFVDVFAPLVGVENGVIVVSSHLYGELLTRIYHFYNIGSRRPSVRSPYLCFKRLILDDIHSAKRWCTGNYNICPLFLWSINSTPQVVAWNRLSYYISNDLLTMNEQRNYVAHSTGHVVHVPVPTDFYQEPEIQVHKKYYQSNDSTRLLNNYLPPEVRAMLDTGDFDGAYQAMLGSARGEEENSEEEVTLSGRKPLHELVLHKFHRELGVLKDRLERLIQNGFNTENVEAAIREQNSRIESLKERLRVAETETTECPICMDDTERCNLVTTKCCFNSFCRECIVNGCLKTNKTCPLCRKRITPMDIYTLRDDGTAVDMDLTKLKKPSKISNLPPTPMSVLYNIIQQKPEGKFVVFAPHEGTSKTLHIFLKENGIVMEDMCGMACTMQKRLERFEKGEIKVLFLNSKSSNAGLNLQFATDVVIFDSRTEFNPNSPEFIQSIGRVRRFPRRDPVPVHYICPDS
jgi:hypothetical protein